MTRVVATGTFDIIHPGHLFYLAESRKLGDELYVIVARDANVRHKPRPVIREGQRRNIVASLKPVDYAVLGDLNDMFRPIEEIRPDIITIGYNQHFDIARLKQDLADRHSRADVVRIGTYSKDPFCSSRLIVAEILKREGCTPGPED
jgi:FAD synthetase